MAKQETKTKTANTSAGATNATHTYASTVGDDICVGMDNNTTDGIDVRTRYQTGTDDTAVETVDIELNEKLEHKQVAFGLCKAGEINEDERTVKAVVSTGVVDRDKEVLRPKGALIDNFVKNPVVPWSHYTSQPPVGKALWIQKGSKYITAKVQFAKTERAEEIWQLFKGGFLKAFSVGFIPLKGHRPTPDEIKKEPQLADARFIFDEWELLEFSPVTIPANPQALAQAVKQKQVKLSDNMINELDLELDKTPEPDTDCKQVYEVMVPVKDVTPIKKINVQPLFSIDKI